MILIAHSHAFKSRSLRALLGLVFVLTSLSLSALSPGTITAQPQGSRLAAVPPGPAWAWGDNILGQLGDGTTTPHLTPAPVPGLTKVTALSAGGAFSLAVMSDGTVWSWGHNNGGMLGDGTSGASRPNPAPVAGLTGFIAVAAGEYHALALRSDGTVWSWGTASYGALGDGAKAGSGRNSPGQVLDLTGAIAIAAGSAHSVALKSDGTVWTFGSNRQGQLGLGIATSEWTSTPKQVPGLSGITAIAAGYLHTLAVDKNGLIYAWGYNSNGQIGNDSTTNTLVPTAVSVASGLVGATQVGAGYQHSIALKSDGTVWAWGFANAVGDGTNTERRTPVQLTSPSEVTSIAAGWYQSFALKKDGTAWAWGGNGSGQLGDGTATLRLAPVQVTSLSNATAIAAGDKFTLGITGTAIPTITKLVTPAGGIIDLAGGSGQKGGVTLTFPAAAVPANVNVTVKSLPDAPAGVFVPGGSSLLPRTVEVTTDQPIALGKTVEIRVNLTAEELVGRDINRISGAVVVGSTVEPRPTRVVDPAGGVVAITVDHFTKFTLFNATVPGPTLTLPAQNATLPGFGATLAWVNPPGATQYHLQVVPFNGDGPGVNLIQNAAASFTIPAPPDWYGLLPDLSYLWRVRTATVNTSATESDWSAWSSGIFRTPRADSTTVTAIAPAQGSTVTTPTPSLQWANSPGDVFYYELQLSKDQTFTTDPATATAMVYGVLIHGGVTTPRNTYAVPAAFPLEGDTTYYWRVRPRVQGDGAPVAWSVVWSFATGG